VLDIVALIAAGRDWLGHVMGIRRSGAGEVAERLDEVEDRVEEVGRWYAKMLIRMSEPAEKDSETFATEPGFVTVPSMGVKKVEVNVMLDPETL
jgi:hypothetical protein